MQVRQLLDHLDHLSGFQFQGDSSSPFASLSIRLFKVRGSGHYAVLLDDSWSRATRDREPLNQLTLREKLATALERGYTGFICDSETASEPALQGYDIISADSSRELCFALLQAVQGYRGESMVAAITGSVGKSTTRGMLVHALRSVERPASSVFAPSGLQNTYSYTMNHLSKVPSYRYTAMEVSAGSLKTLRDRVSVSPDVAIVTGISEAHMDVMGSLRGVAERKALIFAAPPPGGTAVINRDTPESDYLINQAVRQGCQLVTYGESPDATIRLISYDDASGHVVAKIGVRRVEYHLGARGHHNAINSLAVLAALRSFRHPRWRDAMRSLRSFEALPGRGQRSALKLPSGGQATLIDDAYNANPASMRASLRMLSSAQPGESGRRIAVLGDMLELGPSTSELHRALESAVLNSGADTVHLFGELMLGLRDQLRSHTDIHHWQDDSEALALALQEDVSPGDVLLVKASQGTGLHAVVDSLKAAYPPPA